MLQPPGSRRIAGRSDSDVPQTNRTTTNRMFLPQPACLPPTVFVTAAAVDKRNSPANRIPNLAMWKGSPSHSSLGTIMEISSKPGEAYPVRYGRWRTCRSNSSHAWILGNC